MTPHFRRNWVKIIFRGLFKPDTTMLSYEKNLDSLWKKWGDFILILNYLFRGDHQRDHRR